MWKKVVSFLNKYFSEKKEEQVVIKIKTKREICSGWVKEISPEKFMNYHSSMGLALSVKAAYPNIDRYTEKLKELNLLLREGSVISPERVLMNEAQLSLDRFMISDDGFYQNIPEAVKRFKDASLNLCQSMEKADTVTHGVDEHNMRMLTKLFINITEISVKLIEVSLTQEVIKLQE